MAKCLGPGDLARAGSRRVGGSSNCMAKFTKDVTHKMTKDIDFGYTQDHARKNADTVLPAIQCWENQYKRDYEVRIELPEFTSVCPQFRSPGAQRIKFLLGMSV